MSLFSSYFLSLQFIFSPHKTMKFGELYNVNINLKHYFFVCAYFILNSITSEPFSAFKARRVTFVFFKIFGSYSIFFVIDFNVGGSERMLSFSHFVSFGCFKLQIYPKSITARIFGYCFKIFFTNFGHFQLLFLNRKF